MSDEDLAKDLGPLAALTIGVGTMIGAGIFVLPGEAAAAAGPIVALSFVIGGVISLFTALSASELGTAMPKAGGSYYYVNHALGPLFGSIAGWGNWIGLAFASAFYMLGFGEYLVTFLSLPTLTLAGIGLTPHQTGAIVAGSAFVGVNYVGAKETGRLQNIIVIALVAILTIFSVLGALQADFSTLTPIAPKGSGAILPATALIFVSYLGFAKITTVAEEIRNPGRNLPLAIIGSVVIVTVMYAVIMVVLMGVINWDILGDSQTPVLDVAEIAFGTVGITGLGIGLLTFAGLLATASSANASILASSRINFAMGRDKLISARLSEVHHRFATPYRSIAVTGGLILAFIVVGDVETLAKAGSVLHLIVYGLLNLALIVMREAAPSGYDPDFEVPLYPIVPLLGAVTSFSLIAFMELNEIGLALLFVVGGIVWYFAYARKHTEKRGVLAEYILREREQMPDAAVSAAATVQPESSRYRIMVPLANPEHKHELIELASTIARQKDGVVDAIHIVTVPDQTALSSVSEHLADLDPESKQLLATAEADAETFGVPIETTTVLSHRGYEEIFDAARDHNADLVIMGWGEHGHARVEPRIRELTGSPPCDFLVLRDRDFDPEHILVPTAGGPDSDLSAEVAKLLHREYGSEVTLLHVTDDPEEGETFLQEWATEHDLEDGALRVETGDVETAIKRAAEDATVVVIGATEQGLLARLVTDSLILDVVNEIECSVLLAERPTERSLYQRLFGSE